MSLASGSRPPAHRKAVLLAGFLAAGSLLSGEARAFERSRVPDLSRGPGAPCLHWKARALPFYVNRAGSRDAPGALEAARRSFATWTRAADCTDLRFDDRGLTDDVRAGFDQTRTDNTNLVVFREQTCAKAAPSGDPCFAEGTCANAYLCWDQSPGTIAITTTTFLNQTGEILDADIEMNGAGYVFTTLNEPPCPKGVPILRPATCAATDVENTVTHEIGHVLGLDHTNVIEATMYFAAEIGETLKRSLAPDDLEGLCAIYPVGEKATTCVAPVDEVDDGCPACSAGGAAPVAWALLALGATRRRRRCPK